MLSLKHCRRKLGAGCALEDKELARIEDSLYSLAAVILSAFLRELADSPGGSENRARVKDEPDGWDASLIHFEEIERKHEKGCDLLSGPCNPCRGRIYGIG
jgi:hypothetical protein